MSPEPQSLSARLSITEIPEAIAFLRHELATMLRSVADEEPSPTVAARLREIAALFETGQPRG